MSDLRRAAIISAVAAGVIVALLGLRAVITTGPLEVLRHETTSDGSEVFTGSWSFPRGGPYLLGYQCAAECALEVDGVVLSRRAGLVKIRRVYDPGVYSVRFSRRGGGRLLWHPPGRRGPLEYVPASSLSPEVPELARFGSGAGASISDGVIALGILAAIICALIAFGFRALRCVPLAVWVECGAVFSLALLARLYGMGDAGQTWDEDVYWSAGRNYVTNLLALDFRGESWIWNLEHPPVTKYLVGIGAQLTDGYGAARAVSAVTSALACALLVPIARRLGLGSAGLFAGIFAALSPHLIAHGQIVGHESPSTLWWALGVLVALRVWPRAEPRASRAIEWRVALVGVVVGLAVFSRFSNALLGPLLYAIVIIRAPGHRRLEVAWKSALIMPAAALAIGVALWPRLWSTPFANIAEAWEVLKKPHSPEPFLGVMTNRPPPHYFAIYLAATAPIGLLIAALVGAVGMVARFRASSMVVIAWLLAPLLVIASPVRQDGVRYILPCLPVLALLAGVGCQTIGRLLARHGEPAVKRLGHAAAALVAAYLVMVCSDIRPYYLDYYGEHMGGAKLVSERRALETAWWGEGLSSALAYLNEHAEPDAVVFKGCVEPGHLAWLRADLWKREARSSRGAEWVLAYGESSRRCRLDPEHEAVFEVRADGAVLARVYRRRPAD